MAEKESYLDQLMEQMRREKAMMNLFRDLSRNSVPISALMLRDIMKRVESAESKEEGEQMLRKFFRDVIQGKITPFQ